MMKGPKKVEVEIEMNGEGPKGPMSGMAQGAEMEEEDMYGEMTPKGKFTPKGLQPLVKATNILLPLFGQTPDYPAMKEAVGEIPVDLFRVLTMFAAAVDDAISNEIIAPEMKLSFDGLRDDSGLMLLAGKLSKLALDREFKKFLKEPAPEAEAPTVDEERTPMPEMGEEEANNMMMSRMS